MNTPKERVSRFTVAAVFLVIAAVYWFERGRNPGWGDSLGFLVSALEGFSWSVNATGHFLYSLVTATLLQLVPSADPVSLLTATSIVFSLFTLFQIYRAAVLITGDFRASLTATLMLAFSFTFWRQAESIEVYPLHLALVATCLLEMTRSVIDRKNHRADLIGILIGLALLVHIQTILLIPAFVYWCVSPGNARPMAILRSTTWIAGALLLLVIAAGVHPELTIASVFVDFRFAGQVFALDPRIMLTGFIQSIAYLIYNFHFFLPFVIIGAVRLFRYNRRLFTLYAWIVIPIWVFAFRYPVSDAYVFYLPAYPVLALVAAPGFSIVVGHYDFRKPLATAILVTAFVLSPIIYGLVDYTTSIIPPVRFRFLSAAYKGGSTYYVWPGMRRTPDLLARVRDRYPSGECPSDVDQTNWGNLYPLAVTYLRRTGELP